MARRYDQLFHDRVVHHLDRLHEPLGPSGPHRLVEERADVTWPVGCYIATDAASRVLYVGKVCRRDLGFDARFAGHHQPVGDWHTVWLLPLRPGLPNRIVEVVEAILIAILEPTANRVRPRLSLRTRHAS